MDTIYFNNISFLTGGVGGTYIFFRKHCSSYAFEMIFF